MNQAQNLHKRDRIESNAATAIGLWTYPDRSALMDRFGRNLVRSAMRAELRQILIEKTQRVRRLDDTNAGGALLFDNLIAEGLHPRPMNFGPEMMFGVVAVEEPNPVVELVVTAHAPRDRLIGMAAVVPVVAVQVGQAMAEVPEANEENDVMPIQD